MMIDSCLSPCSSLLSSIYLDNCSELYSMWKSRSYRFESDRSPDIGSCSSNGKSAWLKQNVRLTVVVQYMFGSWVFCFRLVPLFMATEVLLTYLYSLWFTNATSSSAMAERPRELDQRFQMGCQFEAIIDRRVTFRTTATWRNLRLRTIW